MFNGTIRDPFLQCCAYVGSEKTVSVSAYLNMERRRGFDGGFTASFRV